MKESRILVLEMSKHMDFIGQRADGFTVEADYTEDGAFVKKIEYRTATCPDCDGIGYYDDIGEIVCEDCGVVISGDKDPVVPTEYNANNDAVGSSRGLEKMGGTRGSRQPRI